MIVTRKSVLMSQASPRIMRAAGRAASSAALQSIANRQAMKQHADLMANVQAEPLPVFLPPNLYAFAEQAGYDMREYRATQLMATR